MKAPISLILVTVSGAIACGCADRRPLEDAEPAEAGLDQTSSSGATSTMGVTSTAGTTEDPVDASRFIGSFHNENAFLPFGRAVENTGEPSIANLEIRPDGSASMTFEICSELYPTREITWRWDAQPGPWLVFAPGPGEESLRFMASDDLESLRATFIDDCDLQFEVDGVPVTYETFRLGRACWVNRCEPTWTVHIDYCDGEDPVVCE